MGFDYAYRPWLQGLNRKLSLGTQLRAGLDSAKVKMGRSWLREIKSMALEPEDPVQIYP